MKDGRRAQEQRNKTKSINGKTTLLSQNHQVQTLQTFIGKVLC